MRDGKLKAGCKNCTKNYLDIKSFAPPDSNRNGRRRPEFLNAVAAFEEAYEVRDLDAAREARAKVEETRNAYCQSCQEVAAVLSPNQKACKDEYIRMRKAACTANGGCANQDCVERGEQAWCVLHGDHLHTINEEDEAKRKTHALGDYFWWSWNGGVEAMRKEEAKGVQWICGFCHFLEKTSTAANRCPDPDTMPDGRSGKNATKEEVAQYYAKRHAKIKYPKQQHVDAWKRTIGACKGCGRSDVEGKEWAFHCDHRDPTTKMIGKHTLAGESGGVGGLVHNNNKAAALDAPGFEEVLQNEIDLCDLLCHNCHHRKTWGYPMRE